MNMSLFIWILGIPLISFIFYIIDINCRFKKMISFYINFIKKLKSKNKIINIIQILI